MSAPALWVQELRLDQFRNYAAATLALDSRPVCLFGPNGAGKTNLLEAITCLAPGRGLRGAGAPELARDGSTAPLDRGRLWTVSATLRLDDASYVVGGGVERVGDGLKRIARVDGVGVTQAALAALFRVAWVTPAMDRLFAGPPADRRRFLDRLALARAPEHGAAALAYERALRERTRLLAEERPDPSWLDGLEAQMAAHGAALAAARAQTVSALAQAIASRPEGAFPKAVIALEGALEQRLGAGAASADVEDAFARDLRRNRARDAAAGRALEGPHRSDLLVRHAVKDMPAELCSTGEQKALLLGLMLAHARALAAEAATGPTLLLLDEAAAHLDAERRAALFEELLALPGQSWLTGTDAGLFEAFGDRAQFWRIAEGAATKVS